MIQFFNNIMFYVILFHAVLKPVQAPLFVLLSNVFARRTEKPEAIWCQITSIYCTCNDTCKPHFWVDILHSFPIGPTIWSGSSYRYLSLLRKYIHSYNVCLTSMERSNSVFFLIKKFRWLIYPDWCSVYGVNNF